MAKDKVTITGILNTSSKKMEASEKLEAIAGIVAKAREKYGNSEEKIDEPQIGTCEGVVDYAFLSNEDKLSVVERAVKAIRQQAIETTKSTQGTMLEAEIVRLIAVNPVLTNCTAATESDYL